MSHLMNAARPHFVASGTATLAGATSYLKANPRCAFCKAPASRIVTSHSMGRRVACCGPHADEVAAITAPGNHRRLAEMAARLRVR